MNSNTVVFKKFDSHDRIPMGYPLAVKTSSGGLEQGCKLEWICCKEEEIKRWKNAGYKIFDVAGGTFDAEFAFKDLTTEDCPEPVNADFAASFRVIPNNLLAEFLLTQSDDKKTQYTVVDLGEYLRTKYDLPGYIRRILAGKNINLLEKYGKEAVGWDGLGNELPSFLAIDKINRFNISVKNTVPQKVLDDAQNAAQEFEAEIAELQKSAAMQQVRNEFEKITHQCAMEAAAREVEKIDAATEVLVAGANQKLTEISVGNVIIKEKAKTVKAKCLMGVIALLILAAAIWFGKQKWAEYKQESLKQQPAVLIHVADYQNSKKEFEERIWPELEKYKFAPPEITENNARFLGTMERAERDKLLKFLREQQKKSFIELLSIPQEKLPASPYDLVGYELRTKQLKIGKAVVVIIGRENADAIRNFLLDKWGVYDNPRRHPSIPSAVIYNVKANISEIIGMRSFMEKEFHIENQIEVDELTDTITVHLPNNPVWLYHFDTRELSAEKLKKLKQVLKQSATFYPGYVEARCRLNDMVDYRTQLESCNIVWRDEKSDLQKRFIMVTLLEKKTVYTLPPQPQPQQQPVGQTPAPQPQQPQPQQPVSQTPAPLQPQPPVSQTPAPQPQPQPQPQQPVGQTPAPQPQQQPQLQQYKVRVLLNKGDEFEAQKAAVISMMNSENAKKIFLVGFSEGKTVGSRYIMNFEVSSYQNKEILWKVIRNLLGACNVPSNKISVN